MSAVASPAGSFENSAEKVREDVTLAKFADMIIAPLASQKIAVAAFAYGIFVILVGTLAQVDKDIWQVVPEYFRAVIMRVDINLFFPPAFFPEWKRLEVPPIPMPGGMVVGVTMILNMMFAHARWVLQLKTKWSQAIGGLGLIAFGWLVTLLVIINGHNGGGFQAKPPFTWGQFWAGLQLSLIAIWVTSVFCYFWFAVQPIFRVPKVTTLRAVLGALFGVGLAALSAGVWYLLFMMEEPGGEGLRIVWQLMKGTGAGLILLPGCWLLFQKRGGVVLLHQGMLLLMLNELFVAHYAIEYNMSLTEGQTSNYLRDIRTTELAMIDRSGAKEDQHFVVPMNALVANAEKNAKAIDKEGVIDTKLLKPIPDPKGILPVTVSVAKYVRNADLRKLKADEKSSANKGIGETHTIVERTAAKGTDTEGSVDLGAAYIHFKDKKTGEDLGTFLLAQTITEQDNPKLLEEITDGDKKYLAALRFKRQFVPFTIQLKDVRKDDYVASNTPRNYSSDIVLKDPKSGVSSDVHIKMNDPLRYSGMTIYQSGYQVLPGGVEHTTLQVVQNVGWMIPYVALMIITVGMLAHFLSTLTRFLRRRENEEIAAGDIILADISATQPVNLSTPKKAAKRPTEVKPLLKPPATRTFNSAGLLAGIGAATLIFVAFVGYALRDKTPRTPHLELETFGKLPVAGNGRVMPYDTLVRNVLLQLRQRETAKTKDGTTISGTQWFLDLITGAAGTPSHRVFKIDNPEVRKVFELDESRDKHVYSTEELFPKIQEFENQVRAARQRQKEDQELTVTQRKLLHMDGQLSQYMVLVRAFNPPSNLPPPIQEGDDPATMQRKIQALQLAIMESAEVLEQAKPPLAIPLPDPKRKGETKWQSFHNAAAIWIMQNRMSLEKQGTDPTTDAYMKVLTAYRQHAIPRDELLVAKQELQDLKNKKSIANRRAGLEAEIELLKKSADRQPGMEREIARLEKEITDLNDSNYVAKRQSELPGVIEKLEKEQLDTIDPFNQAVRRLATAIERTNPPEYNGRKLDLEVWMNRVSPFYVGMQLYVAAFLIACFGWLIPSRSCNWASFTLIFLTFVLHTAALGLRIYISGRPPVTNLYSSAVFIGWFCVLVGLIIELVFRIGLGNLVSTISGFATLIIAYFLSMSGDTIGVMQAVLDTQFWLATHVVCITLGYGATFFAGFLGLLFVVLGLFTPGLTAEYRRLCARKIYGVVCFAMFFSFVGTVLGGLWADDSWGRFWGWDPKENGALIIVLWNALILHAKWDKMVGDRGLALLAIGGNIVTAWSWFGVNELGVGLHSYGFTEGVLLALIAFVLSQIALIVVGAAVPMHMWYSVKAEELKFKSVLLDGPLAKS